MKRLADISTLNEQMRFQFLSDFFQFSIMSQYLFLHSTFNDYSTTLFFTPYYDGSGGLRSAISSWLFISSLYDPTCDGREDFYSGLSRGLKIMFTLRQFFHKPWNWIMKEYIYRFCKTIILFPDPQTSTWWHSWIEDNLN